MEDQNRTIKRLTDPRALRALAHPLRLSLVGLLRREGPLTATRAGELLGESSGSCSFHLRQLAKYGLVEEAGGGRGREKPWQATAMFTGWPDVTDTPELAAATGLLRHLLAERYFEATMRWIEAQDDEPREWQEAALFGDTMLYATPEELTELGRAEQKLLEPFFARQVQPGLRPPGARLVTYVHLAFPGDLSGTAPAQGSRAPGSAAPGSPALGAAAPGTPASGAPAPGSAAPGAPAPGTPAPGTPAPGTPASGSRSDG